MHLMNSIEKFTAILVDSSQKLSEMLGYKKGKNFYKEI